MVQTAKTATFEDVLRTNRPNFAAVSGYIANQYEVSSWRWRAWPMNASCYWVDLFIVQFSCSAVNKPFANRNRHSSLLTALYYGEVYQQDAEITRLRWDSENHVEVVVSCRNALTGRVSFRFCFTSMRQHRYAQHKMRPIATVVTWFVCLSPCLLITNVTCAKTDKPIRNRNAVCGMVCTYWGKKSCNRLVGNALLGVKLEHAQTCLDILSLIR